MGGRDFGEELQTGLTTTADVCLLFCSGSVSFYTDPDLDPTTLSEIIEKED
jgi:hypothetical protein